MVLSLLYALHYVLRDIWFVSSTGQTFPEGRSTNRTQVLCEVLHPNLSRKTTTPGTKCPTLFDECVGSLTSPANHVTLYEYIQAV